MDIGTFASKRSLVSGAIPLVLLFLLATFPFYFPGYAVVLLSTIFMYVVITVSWAMFSGPTGYISLASAAFFGVGIYASALLGRTFSLAF
jgi:branched-chain amino acid transport system permease protein